MKYLRKFEASKPLDLSGPTVTEIEKLAIAGIESYIKTIFFEDCKSFAYVDHKIDHLQIYFSVEFHSITQDVLDRLKEMLSFFNLELKLEHGRQRIIQLIIIAKSKLAEVADSLEALSTSNKYNM